MDLYATLGVTKEATAHEIKKAFRKLAAKLHPDKGGCREKFQAIRLAHDVLLNEERRKRYDETGNYDDEHEVVYATLVKLFERVVDEIPLGWNLVDAIIAKINQQQDALKQEIEVAYKAIKKLDYVRRRMSCKKERNIFHQAIDKKTEELRSMIAQDESAIEFGKILLGAIADYEWDGAVNPIWERQVTCLTTPFGG